VLLLRRRCLARSNEPPDAPTRCLCTPSEKETNPMLILIGTYLVFTAVLVVYGAQV
jgi:hypothetical protein